MVTMTGGRVAVTLLLLVVLATSGCGGGGSGASSTPSPPVATAALTPATWFVGEGSTLSAAQVAGYFETNQLFFDIQSSGNATGEIKGVITPSPVAYQTDTGDPLAPNPAGTPVTFASLLGGDQVRPRNVITRATAYGSVTLDPLSRRITGFIVTAGIIGISARIHDGLPGTAGDIVVPLVGGPVVWTVPAGTVLNDSQMARLASGAFYFSVNSAAFPDGELRGQLNQRVRCADLNGSSEVPPVSTSAGGTGLLALNMSTQQVSGYVTTTGLSSPIRSVILYGGAEGTNGTFIAILSDSGNGIWSVPPGTFLSTAQVANFSSTGLYFNIRTQNNPGGELRGQLRAPVIKIGTASLSATSETPPTSAPATGEGVLAWNSVTGKVSGSVKTGPFDGVTATLRSGPVTSTGADLLALTANSPVIVAPAPGVSYALDVQPIFTSRCVGALCHATGGLAPMSLESGVSYPLVRLLVVPGNAAASYLVQRLTVNSSSFPQMPLNRPPLNSTYLGLIQDWINKGALDN